MLFGQLENMKEILPNNNSQNLYSILKAKAEVKKSTGHLYFKGHF